MVSSIQTAASRLVAFHRTDRSDAGALISFFRYHGIWAPGVRLFRRLSFQAKAMIVSVAFLIPLAVLGWSFDTAKRADLGFVLAERQGVAYAGPLMTLMVDTLRERHWPGVSARGDLGAQQPDTKAQARLAWQALQAQHVLNGQAMDDAQAFTLLEQALKDEQAPGGSKTGDISLTDKRLLMALSTLLEGVIDKSNLALDPAFSSYYLMDAVMIAAPDLMQSTARLRWMLVNAIKAGGASTTEVVHLDREIANVSRRVIQLEASLGKAGKEQVGLLSKLPWTEVKTAALALTAVADGLVQGKPFPADSVEAARLGDLAVQATNQVLIRGLPLLDEMLAQREQELSGTRDAVNGLTLVCVLLAAYLLLCFYRVTRGGMEEVRHHLSAMTQGDLTTQPRPWGRDEAASLMKSLHDMQQSLRAVVHDVREASDVIVHSSAEIASGAMDLSARTERTASNLEASASSMEEIAATVKQTAEHAGQAATLANGNAEVAIRGGDVIGQVVHTMEGIHQSSNRIADIISVIDGIAFQTNILALNAAVEAARAGEQGRGFAVVAGEVRALAQRSASAAREIKLLINDSVDKVSSGALVVRSAGQTMQDIVGNAQHMNSLLSEIATAAREQSAGVSLIGQSVQDLDRVTQENAALVEETAAASASLKHQALALAQAVSTFRLP